MSKKVTWSESALLALLRAKYDGSKWGFLTGVPDGTGLSKSRTCDALAMGCWQTVGIHLHGFEVKCQRSDWLREIQDPQKAETFAKHCHYWWIVAPDGVVKPEELPGRWGLQVPRGNGLRVVKAADIRDTAVPPDWRMLAAIMRKVETASPEAAALKDEYNRGYRDGRRYMEKRAEENRDRESVRMSREHSQLQQAVRHFEETSGIKIGSWYHSNEVGKAVRAVIDGDVVGMHGEFERTAAGLARMAKSLSAAAENLRAVMPTD